MATQAIMLWRKNPWSDKQDPQILKQGEEDNA